MSVNLKLVFLIYSTTRQNEVKSNQKILLAYINELLYRIKVFHECIKNFNIDIQ